MYTTLSAKLRTVLIDNSYAPNVDDSMFFANLECTLTDMGSYPIIWAGDMNIVMDVILDRSVPSKTRPPKALLTIKKMCCALGLVDVWLLPLAR